MLFSLLLTLVIYFSFNDRIRDAINGGSPFGHPLEQGFATGLYLQVLTLILYSYS